MEIIKTHDITLYGSVGEYDIVLRPLCDEYLPLLYKWNADLEVLYWTEGDDVTDGYDAETVHFIYGKSSQDGYTFLVEVNGNPIGECWLQKMNIPEVIDLYPGQDVQRIDMAIGEKEYWNKGIGTALINMLVDFAFCGEFVEVLHCFTGDYNIRSVKSFLKNGFIEVKRIPTPDSKKQKEEIYLVLTRQQYIERRRFKISSDRIFELPINNIRSSQLYISDGKLSLVQSWFDPVDKSNFDPIPVKLYNGNYLMTDGHTRVATALLAGWEYVPCTWDDDPLDMLAYAIDDKWCIDEGINNAADLIKRIVSYKDYEILWRKRCQEMIIPPSYAAIVARFGGLDGRRNVIVLTDNEMIDTACLIQNDCIPFVKSIDMINLDETDNYSKIYSLEPDDLLILHIGIESWINNHNKFACAFNKPDGVVSKYICIRPTITAHALLDGLNTPYEVTDSIIQKYNDLPHNNQVHVKAKSGTDITLSVINPWITPYNTHEPGANAYLPPAEISYDVVPDTATGTIIVDVTIGELRVHKDLIDSFGLVDAPCNIHIENGTIINISGSEQAERLKIELWKLPDSCRKLVELGIGLSLMTPTGIIGIDESIAGTCHFGFGNGSDNDAPIHLDVVVKDFEIMDL